MKTVLILLIALLTIQAPNAQSVADIKKKVLEAHECFIDGILAEDYLRVSKLLADDVSFGTPGGGFGTKKEYINALKNGTLFYDSVANHVFNIRTYGNIGLVNGNVDLVFRYKDDKNDWFKMLEHLTFTTVYLVDKKTVTMVAWQSTRPVTDVLISLPSNTKTTIDISAQNDTYEIYAVECAHGGWNPTASEIAVGATSTDTMHSNLVFWLLKGSNRRTVLVDAALVDTVKYPQLNYTSPDDALQRIGIKPADVTDIILTHPHFDHIGGIGLFPNAMLWMQEEDYDYFMGKAWQRQGFSLGFNKDDVQKLVEKNLNGNLTLVKGDSIEIMPGLRVFIGSKHTFQSQYVLVNGKSGKTIIASDNIWFYYNLEHLLPIPTYTFDPTAYVNAMKRMKTLVSDTRLIILGHDAAVFSRFPKVANGVVKIELKK